MAVSSVGSSDLFLAAVRIALCNMDRSFTSLSRIHFDELPAALLTMLKSEKVQERPFAYEFYHQFRKLWECGAVGLLGFGDTVIQAEVNKVYQNIPGLKKVPDFLVHKVGKMEGQHQVGVIEFKLAENVSGRKAHGLGNEHTEVQYDFEKLVVFTRTLRCRYAIEVILGDTAALRNAKAHVDTLCFPADTRTRRNGLIYVIYFDTRSWSGAIEPVVYLRGSRGMPRTSGME
jgi:hypothetical protein